MISDEISQIEKNLHKVILHGLEYVSNTELKVQINSSDKSSKYKWLTIVNESSGEVMQRVQLIREDDNILKAYLKLDNRIITKAGKWNLFVSNGKDRCKIFVEEKNHKSLNSFSYKKVNGNVLTEIIVNQEALGIKSSNFKIENKIKYLPNYVSNVEVIGEKIIFNGYVYYNTNQKFLLLAQQRNGNFPKCIYNEVQYTGNGNWVSSINVADIEKGIWDFYLFFEDESKFRVKAMDTSINNASLHLDLNQKKSSQIKVYMTVKGSLSIEVTDNILEVNDLRLKKVKEDKVSISGQVKILNFSSNSLNLSLISSVSGKKVVLPITLEENNDNVYKINSLVNYNDLIDDIQPSKWHAFIQIDDIEAIRIKIPENENENDIVEKTSYVLEKYPFHIFFYKTIYNNLSISFEKFKMYRDVLKEEMNNKKLHFEGVAFLEYVSEKIQYEREIVFKQRFMEKEIPYKLNCDQNGRFSINIDIEELNTLLTRKKGTIDIYIRYKTSFYSIERKLGKSEYKFTKDGIFGKGINKRKKDYYYYYLTITPAGNYKLNTILLDNKRHNYLKYFQHFDRIRFKNRDVWLVGEREDTAQDTGYYFFKYCRENFPDKEVYYIIDPDSKDKRNIVNLGNVIDSGTMEHFELSAIAKKFIGSHDIEYFLPTKAVDFPSYINGDRVFLQHGILGRRIVEYFKKDYLYPFNLFCVSSESEKKLVVEIMGYALDEVKVTGLTRYDGLIDKKPIKKKNSVLLIPTWRPWLTNEGSIIRSEYFQRYLSLLQDEKLHILLEKYKLTLNFYPHYRMQPYIRNFKDNHHKNINILSLGEENVQDLIINHQLMITDYSSVSMDFNYLNKPVVFYHFDFKKYFKDGILREPDETFIGDIVTEQKELITIIEKYAENGFIEKNAFKIAKSNLFQYRDNHNCQRVYNSINDMQKTPKTR